MKLLKMTFDNIKYNEMVYNDYWVCLKQRNRFLFFTKHKEPPFKIFMRSGSIII